MTRARGALALGLRPDSYLDPLWPQEHGLHRASNAFHPANPTGIVARAKETTCRRRIAVLRVTVPPLDPDDPDAPDDATELTPHRQLCKSNACGYCARRNNVPARSAARTPPAARPAAGAVYHAQMTTRNVVHLKAVCVVAARLAERSWVNLADGQPYQLRDVDGAPVTAEQAKQIIADRYTVPPEVRRRRRSGKQTGKIPQQPPRGGKSQPSAGHEATSPTPTVPDRRRTVKQPN